MVMVGCWHFWFDHLLRRSESDRSCRSCRTCRKWYLNVECIGYHSISDFHFFCLSMICLDYPLPWRRLSQSMSFKSQPWDLQHHKFDLSTLIHVDFQGWMGTGFEHGACHLTEGKLSTTRLGRSRIKAGSSVNLVISWKAWWDMWLKRPIGKWLN